MDTATSLVVARPPVLPSQTVRVPTALGTAFITLARDAQGQPFEVFLNVGKAGTDTFALSEALGRLISLILRLNAPASPEDRLREVAAQLAYIGTTRSGGGQMSLPDALAKTLQGFLTGLVMYQWPRQSIASRLRLRRQLAELCHYSTFKNLI